MVYKLVYTKSAERDLDCLDSVVRRRIFKKMDEYLGLKDPMDRASKLKGFEVSTYKFRVGDYRVIFRLDSKTRRLVVLVVLKIKHRKEVYKK